MIILTGKIVFVKTQEEYLSVLKMAKLQGFTWARENHLNPIVIPFPNILNFYDSKMVTYNYVEKTVYEASEIVEDEEKIKDAVKLVRTFAKYPDRTALTESFIDSLKLLVDTVESQMKEVKQMERLTERYDITPDGESDVYVKNHDYIKASEKLAEYEDLEEQDLLVRLPCKVGDTVWVVTSPINVFGYDEYDGDAEYEVYESFLSSVSYYASGEQFRIYAKVTNSFITAYFRECDFGESIFLTREDAEKKLKELKNEI